MLNRASIQKILDNLKYRDWEFYLGDDNGRMYLQMQFYAFDIRYHATLAGVSETLQKGRKWMLSPHATPTEIVRTAHKAVQAAVEHEVDENFMYKNHRIYGPHIDVEALVDASEKVEVRI